MPAPLHFRDHSNGIYQQIADYCIDRVLRGDWAGGEQIPSVRQLAADVGVNPNTVQRAYGYLQDLQIAEPRRGLGLFILPEGQSNARQLRRNEFATYQLPELVRTLRLLDISLTELMEMIAQARHSMSLNSPS
jgi:DNA-binding transcriptional regulator YhcF (GntR family)